MCVSDGSAFLRVLYIWCRQLTVSVCSHPLRGGYESSAQRVGDYFEYDYKYRIGIGQMKVLSAFCHSRSKSGWNDTAEMVAHP